MKKQAVNNVENVANVVASLGNVTTKGDKPAPAGSANETKATRKETRGVFMQFIISKEEISINKFFKLFTAFKEENPAAYGEFLAARNLDFSADYSFVWFAANCPAVEVDGKKTFAYWKRVTDNQPANDNPAFNRVTKKGVQYTLVPYNCHRANWEQFEKMFNDVLREISRKKREKAKADFEKKKAETVRLLAEKKAAKIEALQKELTKLQGVA